MSLKKCNFVVKVVIDVLENCLFVVRCREIIRVYFVFLWCLEVKVLGNVIINFIINGFKVCMLLELRIILVLGIKKFRNWLYWR